jgi:hypothetical protein
MPVNLQWSNHKPPLVELAAKTILNQVLDALAYAGTDQPQITGHIPLPKKRPIPR